MSKTNPLQKTPTGILGLDEITGGGLPTGRCTLVSGPAGGGKTLLAMEFLIHGARAFGEPGIFVSFDEREEDIKKNFASLDYDLDELLESGKLLICRFELKLQDMLARGEKDFAEFFQSLEQSIARIGARRVVLDSLGSLLLGSNVKSVIRGQIACLYDWLKKSGVTSIITAEGGTDSLTHNGEAEYVSDCVIVLDHRISEHLSTRRLRVAKYRGSAHETSEYPFLIENKGLSVLPITSAHLNYPVSNERLSCGLPGLDAMLGGQGYFRGSSVLISGTAGTGKSTLAALFVESTCLRGEQALYISFEESSDQIVRNQRSVGIDLQPWIDKKLLTVHAVRPTMYSLESHLVMTQRLVDEAQPAVVVIDPITNFLSIGTMAAAKLMLVRLVDSLKMNQITTVFNSLTSGNSAANDSEADISSLIDTWLMLGEHEVGHHRQRTLTILKSRGMPHDSDTRRLIFSDNGVTIEPFEETA